MPTAAPPAASCSPRSQSGRTDVKSLVILAGFVLGILAGTSLVLGNPLAWFRGLPPLSADIAPARTYRWDDTRGMPGAVTDLLGVGRQDRAVGFPDPALAHVRAGIVVVPAGAGSPAALAVKVAAVDPANALWKAQLGTDDFWLIAWPGEGSVFATGYSNFWTLARDSFFATIAGGDRLAPSYALTAPAPSGAGPSVTGASGRYAGFTGEIRETLYLPAPGAERREPDWAVAIKANPPPVGGR